MNKIVSFIMYNIDFVDFIWVVCFVGRLRGFGLLLGVIKINNI